MRQGLFGKLLLAAISTVVVIGLLEKHLTREGMPAEVFNVAIPGWSARQELLAWRRIASKYKPEIVLLGVCLNDIAEMHNNLSKPLGDTAFIDYDHLSRNGAAKTAEVVVTELLSLGILSVEN